jgi:two-component system response regulator PilR (NtrC family)
MSKETILILDNERYIQWTLKNLLEGEEYTILSSDSIGTVMPIFSEREVACLITEYWIDNVSTLELVRGLKKTFPETYVMMLTSKELSDEKYKEILNAGVDDLFKKPFPAGKIFLHLKKGLRQRNIFLQKKQLERELDRIDPGRYTDRISSWAESLPL